MKGGIVEALYAVKVLSGLGLGPKSRVVVLCNSDEEIGSPSSRPLIEDEARKSKAVLVLEPSAQGGSLKTWRKGVGMFEVTIRGRAAHAARTTKRAYPPLKKPPTRFSTCNLTDLDEGTTVNVGIVRSGTRRNVVAEEAILGST